MIITQGIVMRRFFILAGLCAVIQTVSAGETNTAANENPGKIILAEHGKGRCVIVVPDTPLPLQRIMGASKRGDGTERAAAEILRDHIRLGWGADIPIVSAKDTPDEGLLILVGQSSAAEKFGVAPPSESGAFRIKAFSRGVAIAGEIAPQQLTLEKTGVDRGITAGVYAFLERFGGFMFVIDDRASINAKLPADFRLTAPSSAELAVPAGTDITSAPVFPYRNVYTVWSVCPPEEADNFSANHSHSCRDGSGSGWPAYKDSRPEYFLMKDDGTRNFKFLCYGNPDVLALDIEHIEEFYKTGNWKGGGYPPTAKYVKYEPDDNQPPCKCEKCKPLLEPDKGRWGKESRLHWTYVNNLAKELKKRMPDKKLAALAYQGHTDPPDFPLEDNVSVMVCMLPFSTAMGALSPACHSEIMRRLSKWNEKLGGDRSRLYMWDYACYPTFWTAAPVIYPHYLQQLLKESGGLINGVFVNTGAGTLQSNHFMFMVWGRLLWNPEADVDALLKDYCRAYYGPAAAAMENFYKICEDRWEKSGLGKFPSSC